MTLTQRLTKYILSHPGVTLDGLVEIAVSKGFTEAEVYTALEAVHRDKRIHQTSTQAGVVSYRPAMAKAKSPTPGLDWIRENYVRPHHCEHKMEYTSCEHCMPFPTISYSHLFLTPAEMKEFKIEQRGGYRPKSYPQRKSWHYLLHRLL